MKGLNLRSLSGELYKVDATFAKQPIKSIDDIEQKLEFYADYIKSHFDTFSFEKDYWQLPLDAFSNFSFDELCKLKYSADVRMDSTVGKLFETRPNYEVVRKIISSMCRWGLGRGTWNELVDFYQGIQGFSIGLGSDFEIRLDYTTYDGQFGRSKYSRTFLDGVFAFLIYYKHKHVMTIGFSLMENRRILIQQIQLKQRSGNRWLYKFPKNRLEFVIDLFTAHFPEFMLYVIDGKDLVKKTLADYYAGLARARKRVERNRESSEVEIITAKIAHLKSDAKRLSELYSDSGKYVLGKRLVVSHITHRPVQLKYE